MTVCVGIKVRDCIVFAADSAMSVIDAGPDGKPVVLNIWNHGLKVYNLYKGLPIMAMTAGMANFGSISVSNMAKDLRQNFSQNGEKGGIDPEAYSVADVAQKAGEFFYEQYQEIQPPPVSPHSFDFWIGGYGSSASHGEIWKIGILDGNSQEKTLVVDTDTDNIVVWGGQEEAISRLLLGMSPLVRQQLLNLNITEGEIGNIQDAIQTPLVDPTMPVQDAIDLAEFLVDTTKRYFAFHHGANVVGGETDIATVTKHEGFKWIKRKHYYPENLNR